MQITEVLLQNESEHCVLPRDELKKRLERDEVEGLFKFGVYGRDDPGGEVKATHDLTKGTFEGYLKDRPVASSNITSSKVDRDGDIVSTKGMQLTDNYWSNPVVLPMHQHSFPVGLTRKVKQYKTHAWAEWEWLIDQEYTNAGTFQRAWDAYVLNSTSIGFLPIQWDAGEDKAPGWIFHEWELMEHSPVVIPSNREAMRTDGVRDVVEAFAGAVESGPSPLAKGFLQAGLEKMERPKQVAVEGPRDGDGGGTGGLKDMDRPKQVAVEGYAKVDSAGSDILVWPKEGVDFGIVEDAVQPDPDLEIAKECAEVEDEAVEEMVQETIEREVDEAMERTVITYSSAHPDGTSAADPDREWDASAEVAAADVDDLKTMCAWYDPDNADVKSAYKFPHHHADGKAVNKRACSAIIAVLNGGRGGSSIPDSDRKGVYNHAAKHLRDDFDVDSDDVPDLKYLDLAQIKMAHAAGALSADEAYEAIENLLREYETDAEAARAEAAEYKTYCAVFSALIVGGDLDA